MAGEGEQQWVLDSSRSLQPSGLDARATSSLRAGGFRLTIRNFWEGGEAGVRFDVRMKNHSSLSSLPYLACSLHRVANCQAIQVWQPSALVSFRFESHIEDTSTIDYFVLSPGVCQSTIAECI